MAADLSSESKDLTKETIVNTTLLTDKTSARRWTKNLTVAAVAFPAINPDAFLDETKAALELSSSGADSLFQTMSTLRQLISDTLANVIEPESDLNSLETLLRRSAHGSSRLTGTKLRLAFLGPSGLGKSFMFSKLIGEHLSQEGACVNGAAGVTKIPLRVSYGRERVFRLVRRDGEHARTANSIDEFAEVINGPSRSEYLCIDVTVDSAFLRDNEVEMIDLPGLQVAEDQEFCAPFLFGEHRVDLVLSPAASRAPDSSFVDRLYDTGVLKAANTRELPRIVFVMNDLSDRPITIANKDLTPAESPGEVKRELNTLPFASFEPALEGKEFVDLVDATNHRMVKVSLQHLFLLSLASRNRERNMQLSPMFMGHLVRRFSVAVFIAFNGRLEDTKAHFARIIEETRIMRNLEEAGAILHDWKRVVNEHKELLNAMTTERKNELKRLLRELTRRMGMQPRPRFSLGRRVSERVHESLSVRLEADPQTKCNAEEVTGMLLLALQESLQERQLQLIETTMRHVGVWESLVAESQPLGDTKESILTDTMRRYEDLMALRDGADSGTKFYDVQWTPAIVADISVDMLGSWLSPTDDLVKDIGLLYVAHQDNFANALSTRSHANALWSKAETLLTNMEQRFEQYDVAGKYEIFRRQRLVDRPKNSAATTEMLDNIAAQRKRVFALESVLDSYIAMVAPHMHWRKDTNNASSSTASVDSTMAYPTIDRVWAPKLDKLWEMSLQTVPKHGYVLKRVAARDGGNAPGPCGPLEQHSRFWTVKATIGLDGEGGGKPSVEFEALAPALERVLSDLGKATDDDSDWLNPVFVLSKLRMQKKKVARVGSAVGAIRDETVASEPSFHFESFLHAGDRQLRKLVIAVVDGDLGGQPSVTEYQKYCDNFFVGEASAESMLMRYLAVSEEHYFVVLHVHCRPVHPSQTYVLNVGRKRQVVKLFAEEVAQLDRYWVSDDDLKSFRETNAALDKAVTTSRALMFGQKVMTAECNGVAYSDDDMFAFGDILDECKDYFDGDIKAFKRLKANLSAAIKEQTLDRLLENKGEAYGHEIEQAAQRLRLDTAAVTLDPDTQSTSSTSAYSIDGRIRQLVRESMKVETIPAALDTEIATLTTALSKRMAVNALQERLRTEVRAKGSEYRVGVVGFIQQKDRLRTDVRTWTANLDVSHIARSSVFQMVLFNRKATRNVNYVEPDHFYRMYSAAELGHYNRLRKAKTKQDVLDEYGRVEETAKESERWAAAKDYQADAGFKHEDRRLVELLTKSNRCSFLCHRFAFEVQPVKSVVNGVALEASTNENLASVHNAVAVDSEEELNNLVISKDAELSLSLQDGGNGARVATMSSVSTAAMDTDEEMATGETGDVLPVEVATVLIAVPQPR